MMFVGWKFVLINLGNAGLNEVRHFWGLTFKVNIRINLLGKTSRFFPRIFHMLHSESLRQSFSTQ